MRADLNSKGTSKRRNFASGFTEHLAFNALCSRQGSVRALPQGLTPRGQGAGFTLIELLVVITIIAVLSSIVLVNLNSARQKARDTKRVSDIKQLQLALALYFDSVGTYPGTLTSGTNELAPAYIPVIPTPPSGGSQANYTYVPLTVGGGTCNSYHLGAVLESAGNIALVGDSNELGGMVAKTKCGVQGGSNPTTQTPAATTDFNGNTNDCASATGSDLCFDVTP